MQETIDSLTTGVEQIKTLLITVLKQQTPSTQTDLNKIVNFQCVDGSQQSSQQSFQHNSTLQPSAINTSSQMSTNGQLSTIAEIDPGPQQE